MNLQHNPEVKAVFDTFIASLRIEGWDDIAGHKESMTFINGYNATADLIPDFFSSCIHDTFGHLKTFFNNHEQFLPVLQDADENNGREYCKFLIASFLESNSRLEGYPEIHHNKIAGDVLRAGYFKHLK